MPIADDYLSRHQARFVAEGNDSRVLVAGNNVIFANIDENSLREHINHAVAVAVRHFAANLDNSETSINTEHLEQLAIKVALNHLYIYNMWKHTYDEHRDIELRISTDDMESVNTRDAVRFFCEDEFGLSYADTAAALLGMTRQAFVKWEERRQALLDLW